MVLEPVLRPFAGRELSELPGAALGPGPASSPTAPWAQPVPPCPAGQHPRTRAQEGERSLSWVCVMCTSTWRAGSRRGCRASATPLALTGAGSLPLTPARWARSLQPMCGRHGGISWPQPPASSPGSEALCPSGHCTGTRVGWDTVRVEEGACYADHQLLRARTCRCSPF